MAVTFGAVGDIISVSLLIKDLLVALDDSRGASCEYRAIVRELYTLDSAILHVERLSRTHDATPELHALYGTARATVTRCRECIEDFKQKLKKYRGSMVAGGSGNPVKDIGRRLQWSMAEKDHIARFRAEVTGYSNSIHMLIATAGVYVKFPLSTCCLMTLGAEDYAGVYFRNTRSVFPTTCESRYKMLPSRRSGPD